ncbi:DUF3224 domain-containing protein [Ahniella affigens]|uniref:DUF3224 domain-containing protein n=1 Tax=Ahniella affigens TaxID=2021234 RepID=A0A2P1PVA5_9GAMM|nr:DUF3224 domain-containing protein [Ahniella affigens]AVP98778.1 DUF3224 domain-containing protein [Ahniella affigens]
MPNIATGRFEVRLPTLPVEGEPENGPMGRRSLVKRFMGDLEAGGSGQMLMAMGQVPGSAGYVAVERVTGNLHGKDGSFVLIHRGIMNRGEQELLITVVPDSGTDALTGITGTFRIRIENGVHYYDFEYELPEV